MFCSCLVYHVILHYTFPKKLKINNLFCFLFSIFDKHVPAVDLDGDRYSDYQVC